MYLKAVRPHSLKQQLRGLAPDLSLSQLMSRTLDLEPDHRHRPGFNNGPQGGSGGFHNKGIKKGKRIDCKKCGNNHWDDEKCPGKYNQNKDWKGKSPKVHEGTLPNIPEHTESEGEEAHGEEGGYDSASQGSQSPST